MEKGKRRSAGPGRGVEGEAEDREVAAGADQREWERKRRPARPRRSGGRERPLVRRQGRGGLGSRGKRRPARPEERRQRDRSSRQRRGGLRRRRLQGRRTSSVRRCAPCDASGRGAVFPFEKEGEGEAGNRGEALAAAQKAKAEV